MEFVRVRYVSIAHVHACVHGDYHFGQFIGQFEGLSRENKAWITGQHFLESDVIQIFCPVPACRLLSLEAFLAPRPQRKTELVGGRRPNLFYLTQQRSRFLAQVRNSF